MKPSGTTAPKSSTGKNRRAPKGAPVRPNRAQQRAMEVRAAETRVVPAPPPTAAEPDAVEVGSVTRRPVTTARGRTAGTRIRAVARPITLTREQEYRFIRGDMRRLLMTASALVVLMIVLLFLIEG